MKFRQYFRLYQALFKDPRTPKLSKTLPWLALLYILFPFDLIPDILPLLGQIDDLLSIPILFSIAIKLIPEHIYQEHYESMKRNVE